ncbi:hypothetical protein EHS25_002455 [Saitozyma podzolica]|uniref:Uncharacterized protein n=1 Tax=Saitozyma podzolica TaxID=1890683 RepID=A0A427YE68_9TREE|nr:hypothetical protein EHS25_002455 [Saitozyma podzolica]
MALSIVDKLLHRFRVFAYNVHLGLSEQAQVAVFNRSSDVTIELAYTLSGDRSIDDPAVEEWIEDVLRWEKLDRGYNPESLKELLALNKSFKAVWDEYNRTGGAARRMRRNIELWYDLEKDADVSTKGRDYNDDIAAMHAQNIKQVQVSHEYDHPEQKARFVFSLEMAVRNVELAIKSVEKAEQDGQLDRRKLFPRAEMGARRREWEASVKGLSAQAREREFREYLRRTAGSRKEDLEAWRWKRQKSGVP